MGPATQRRLQQQLAIAAAREVAAKRSLEAPPSDLPAGFERQGIEVRIQPIHVSEQYMQALISLRGSVMKRKC